MSKVFWALITLFLLVICPRSQDASFYELAGGLDKGRNLKGPRIFSRSTLDELNRQSGDINEETNGMVQSVMVPVISWNTFMGDGSDSISSIVVDAIGNIYVAGTSSATWGTPIVAYAGGHEAFAAKLNSDGVLLWNTFLGSSDSDVAASIALDGSGNVLVQGTSGATWGTPLKAHEGYNDGFVAKLDSDGALQWNTFIGSGATDWADSMALDGSGNIYVVGSAAGWGWGTPLNGFAGGIDAFIAKLNSSGVAQWNTFMGSSSDDRAKSITVDGSGNIYVAGWSDATWGTPVDAHAGGDDAFVAKFNSGGYLEWNTFMGSPYTDPLSQLSDSASSLVLDGTGNIYVAGYSYGSWGTPVDAYAGGYDVFTAKLNSSGVLLGNTFMGSSYTGPLVTAFGSASSLVLDGTGNIYVAGDSYGTWGTPVNAHAGAYDAFVVKLNGSTAVRQWNTFMGSSRDDVGFAITMDESGSIYVAGHSDSIWGSPVNDSGGAFVAKFATAPIVTTTAVSSITSTTASSGGNVTSDGGSPVTARGVCWSTSASPTTADSKTTVGTGTGTFTSSITSLSPDTIYHVRAYATNSVGTSYGEDLAFNTATPFSPEINIKYDSTSLDDGESYDFGSHNVETDTDVTFTIENMGTADLTLGGSPIITLTGTNSDQFSVQQQPVSLVTSSGSTTFIIRFSPTTWGAKTASISISNNDSDENPYDITLNGAGVENTQGWDDQTADSDGNVGEYTSIALDSNGYPHISYYDETGQNLNYTHWTGTTWDVQTVDSGMVGTYTSIALDSHDYPHISYYDFSKEDLKYAHWTGTAWEIVTVDSDGSVGMYTSIALDSRNYPHISYYDETNEDLKYAYWNGTAVDIVTVDSDDSVGMYTSIALDSNNRPHISYYDNTNEDLKYAYRPGTTWYNQTVHSDGSVGWYSSIAVDSSDYPHICYHDDFPNDYLKYAYWTGTAWDLQTVDSTGNVGEYTSMALDNKNRPHISYYDRIGQDLKYARWTGERWNIQRPYTVTGGVSRVGMYTSITLDRYGFPHISSFDYVERDLKYTTLVDIAVISPNGGESWKGGSLRYITWASSGLVGDVRIEYSTDNGVNWTQIESLTANDGIYSWTVPNTPSMGCKVKISKAAGGDLSPNDLSDSTFSITSATPASISLSRDRLNYGAEIGGSMTGSQSFLVSNSGGGPLSWSVSENYEWMECTPSKGTGAGEVTVSVNASGLSEGTYTGVVSVSDPNAINSPQTLAVTFQVKHSSNCALPFGSFDTPIDGTSEITGAIPVTGWALDDIGVEAVLIYRDPVEGENTEDPIYIGNASFVEGARADVEQAYPDYPLNYQAGWGYMMLTNFLPGQGNGTYAIHAVIVDKEGQYIWDTKIITCDNANAVKPFGAIDTPTQGGTVTGPFFNAGWALTPMPNSIPTDGSTINVWVDGVRLGNPAYNQYRNDIAFLFPGYENTDGAVGAYFLDTTSYTNGVHTIAWSVQDSAGNSDGIGSRFFTIANTGGSAQAEIQNYEEDLRPSISYESILSMLVSFDQIKHRRGYREDLDPMIAMPDEYGKTTLEIREVDRIEIKLGKGVSTGYIVVGDQLRPLPIGSTLDTQNGIFCWQPGPGFIGEYDLVFIKQDEFGMQKRIQVKVRILPKFGISRKDFSQNSKAKGKTAD